MSGRKRSRSPPLSPRRRYPPPPARMDERAYFHDPHRYPTTYRSRHAPNNSYASRSPPRDRYYEMYYQERFDRRQSVRSPVRQSGSHTSAGRFRPDPAHGYSPVHHSTAYYRDTYRESHVSPNSLNYYNRSSGKPSFSMSNRARTEDLEHHPKPKMDPTSVSGEPPPFTNTENQSSISVELPAPLRASWARESLQDMAKAKAETDVAMKGLEESRIQTRKAMFEYRMSSWEVEKIDHLLSIIKENQNF